MTMRLLSLLALLLINFGVHAQALSGIVNAYAAVASINLNVLNVNTTSGFAVGDKVMVIRMKGATVNTTNTASYGDTLSMGEVGKYTFSTIIAMTNNSMTLSPFCDIFNDSTFIQVVRVAVHPNPTVTATVTAQPWNGATGGIIAIETPGTLTLNANINGSNLGYRGGDVWGNTFACGTTAFFSPQGFFGPEGKKGEGIANHVVGQECGRGKLASGGGGAFGGNGGAAGGANAGAGGTGGFEYNGCPILGSFAFGGQAVTHVNTTLLMGGGGGGPQSDNSQQIYNGGNGGAIVFISAAQIVGNGNSIISNGQTTPIINDEGASGGGAGGSIYLNCSSFNTPLTVSAIGGNGGSNNNILFPTNCHGPGGGGGGGLIWFAGANTPPGVTVATQGGSGGFVLNPTSTCYNTQYNAGNGQNGQVKYNFSPTPPPTPPNLNLGPDAPLCAGSSVTLNAGLGYATYLWDNNSTGNSRTVSAPGTFYVTVTTFQGCTASDTVVVYNDTTVVANFQAIVRLGCVDDTVILINNSSAASSQFIWNFGDGTNSTSANPGAHIYTNQGTYTITLIAGNPPCFDTAVAVVTMIHPLQAAYQLNGSGVLSGLTADSACLGTNLLANGALSIPQGFLQYFWNWGDGHTSNTGASPLDGYIYPAAGTYTLTLTVTDTLGCTDDTARIVYIEDGTSVSFTASDDNVCIGEPIQFVGTSSANANLTFWDFDDGVRVFNQPSIVHTFADPRSAPYQVKFTAQFPVCPPDSAVLPITVNPFPVVNLGPDSSLCPGLTGSLLLTDLNNSNAVYTWSTGDNAAAITVTEPGRYWVRATTPGSECSTTDSIWIKRDCYLNVPNAFSPDGDGLNDFFLPRELLSSGLKRFTMSIYNRWGQLIFSTEQIDGRGWDGRYNGVLQPLGTYVYVIDAEFINNVKKSMSGNVLLVR